jgi:hypothetical protein
MTGNEGVGIPAAVQEIYERMKKIYNVSEYSYYNAIEMYDFNDGYVSSMADMFKDNTLICIGNAERLGMRGHNNNKTGIEELCNKMSGMTNSVVVLTGKNNQLIELVKGHEKAREWFPYIFRFEDLTSDALFQQMVELVNRNNYLLDPDTEPTLKDYLSHAYKLRGSNFRNTASYRKSLTDTLSQRCLRE